MASQTLIGKLGRVVRAVRGGSLPGEVRVVVGGIPHYYIAYGKDPIGVGVDVLVINSRGARQIDVEPWFQTGADADDVWRPERGRLRRS